MTKNYTYSEKSNGQTLSAEEWNNLAQDVDALVTGVNNGTIGGSSSSSNSIISAVEDTTATDPTVNVSIESGVTEVGTPNVIQLTKKSKGVNTTVVSGNNVNIEPRESTGKAKSTKGGNISMKPGDDIELCSHHRRFGNRDEVTVKVIDGEDNPVKLQLKVGEITLSTEGKGSTMAKDEDTGLDTETPLYDNANVMDVNVTTGSGKGYLKVRAQAIDLRCEDHGGISLQPKGEDSDHHMNKIKFEHGGGDGLEFGTFNTEHTSLFTGDYRFNKNGTIKLATRTTVASDKADPSDSTTAYKYVKAADDFYDNIAAGDPTCTWEDVVNTANLITTYELDDQNNTIDGGVLKVKGINNNTTNTLTITTANPSTGTVEDYVIPVYTDPASDQVGLLSTRYNPQVIASCSINDIIMFVNWAKGTGFGPWDAQAIANKEELQWNGHEFATLNAIPNPESPITEPA